MHQTRRAVRMAFLPSVAILCAACGALPAHNNTLMFAVKRDLGIGIAAPSATDPEFSLHFGYKERQAAWIPLWVNKTTGGMGVSGVEAMPCPAAGVSVEVTPNGSNHDHSCKRAAKLLGDGVPVGAAKGNEPNDAYSTFASFGGDFTAEKSDGIAGTFKMASFFATGVAAQNLSRDAGGVHLLSNAPSKAVPQDKKQTAHDLAREQLAQYLSVTAQKTEKAERADATCLQKLGKSFEASQADQFVWVAGRHPKDAANQWMDLAALTDAQAKKLIGVAYQLQDAAQTSIQTAWAKADQAKTKESALRSETIRAFCSA